MTIRELMDVSSGIRYSAELIVIDNDSEATKTTLSLREYDNYRKYADYEITMLEQGVYSDYQTDFTRQGSIVVKPKLIIYVYEKGETNND